MLRMIFLFIANSFLFLLPGVAAATTIIRRRMLSTPCLMAVVIATGATLGYCAFWVFFFATLVGKIFSYTVYVFSAALLFWNCICEARVAKAAKAISMPFGYASLAALCYLCFLFLFVDPLTAGASHADFRFFSELRPGDNIIPLIFGEKIFARRPLIPLCCGTWLSSDRPPLQAGIFLLLRPLRLTSNMDLDYELLSAFLQCLWIPGVLGLLRSLGTDRIRIHQVLGILIFSGFLFYNSVYTWPKLFAAACVLFVMSIACEVIRAQRRISYFECALAAICVSLALMAHPGSVFSLPVLALLALRFRKLLPLPQAAIALLILSTFILPWTAYQKFVDPPGNRLLKMHLAGQDEVDSRSTWQAVKDAYTGHTTGEILRFKWSNLAFLLGRGFGDSFGLTDFSTKGGLHIDPAAAESSRIAQREWIWNAVGVANLGWIGFAIVFLRRMRGPAIRWSGCLILAALTDLVIWSVVTFGPNETTTTHSSFADILLLSVGLLGYLLALPRFVALIAFGLQVFNFFVVWVWSSHGAFAIPSHQAPNLALLIAGLAFATTLLWIFGRCFFHTQTSIQSDCLTRSSSEVYHHI